MDIADQAQSQEEVFLNSALKKRNPSLPYNGKCHWCDEVVPSKAHFCDSDCRHDFEKNRHLNGGY